MSAPKSRLTQSKREQPSGGRALLTKFLDKLRGSSAGKASGAAAAPAVEKEHFGPRILVASGPRSEKELIRVREGAPFRFKREDITNFYCLDVEEFGWDGAIDWVRAAHDVDPFGDNNRVPVIYVIGPDRPLDRRELRLLNDELVPAGGYFFARPAGATTFEAAMKALRAALARQLGAAREGRTWRRERKAPERLVVTSR